MLNILTHSIRCQLLWQENPDFVYYETIYFSRNNQEYLIPQQINYSNKQFKSIPIILIGMIRYNLEPYLGKIDIQITSSEISKVGCKLSLKLGQENNDYKDYFLNDFKTSLVAIDVSQFPFINIINTEILDIKFQSNQDITKQELIYEKQFEFSPTILKKIGKKNVAVFLRGYQSQIYEEQNKITQIQILVEQITEKGYTLKILQKKNTISTVSVYLSILEFIENPNSIYGLQYKQNNLKFDNNCIYHFCLSDYRINMGNEIISSQKSSTSYKYIFASNNQVYLTYNYYALIDLQQFSLISQKTFNYQLYFYRNELIQGEIKYLEQNSAFLFFYKKQCLNINDNSCIVYKYFNYSTKTWSLEKPKGTCCQKNDDFYECFDNQIQICDECTTQMNNSSTVCTKCSVNFYLFNGICLQEKPKGSYCQKNDDFYECFDCKIQFCDECTAQMSNSSNVCTKCSVNFYLFNGICLQEKPKGTYCQKKNDFYECFDCKINFCDECTTEMSNSSNVCTKCSVNFYLFNGICLPEKPKRTYCQKNDDFYECFDCKIKFCDECTTEMSNSSMVCTKCSVNFYLFKGICLKEKQKGTYCQKKYDFYECLNCQILYCDECTTQINNSNTLCTKCSVNFYLLNGFCQPSEPDNAYCDNYLCKTCKDSSCFRCSDPNQLSYKCLQCKNGEDLFEDKCQQKPQNHDQKLQTTYNITESKIYNTISVSSKVAVSAALALPNANFVQQLLSVQKLNFLLLINIVYPEQLYISMKALSGTHPLDLFSKINFISLYLLKEQRDDYIGEKFSSEKVQSSIIYNTSGIIVLLVSLYLLHLPFFFVKHNILEEQSASLFSKTKIYLKNKCLSVIILLNELGNQIISFSIYVQILSLVQNQGSSENFIWKIVYLFILSIHQLLFLKKYYDISHYQGFPHQCNYKNKDMGMDKIIYTSNIQRFIDQQFISKNFKILFLLVESTFIPLVITVFYNYHLPQSTFCFVLQLFLCIKSLIIRPFKIKIDNLSLIANQVCWCFIFASLTVLGIYVDKILQNSNEQNDLMPIVNGISTFIIIFLYIIIYIDPLIITIKLILLIPQLVQTIKNYLQKRKNDKENLKFNQQQVSLIKDFIQNQNQQDQTIDIKSISLNSSLNTKDCEQKRKTTSALINQQKKVMRTSINFYFSNSKRQSQSLARMFIDKNEIKQTTQNQ